MYKTWQGLNRSRGEATSIQPLPVLNLFVFGPAAVNRVGQNVTYFSETGFGMSPVGTCGSLGGGSNFGAVGSS